MNSTPKTGAGAGFFGIEGAGIVDKSEAAVSLTLNKKRRTLIINLVKNGEFILYLKYGPFLFGEVSGASRQKESQQDALLRSHRPFVQRTK